jgi:hypothetical protein
LPARSTREGATPIRRDYLRRRGWLAVPLAAYLVVTLVLPLANGAGAQPAFWRHAGWVMAGCLAALAVVLGIDAIVALVRRVTNKVRTSRVVGDV